MAIVDVYVGLPLGGVNVTTGQFGAVQVGPVVVEDNVTVCVAPEVNATVTVAAFVRLDPCSTLPEAALSVTL